VIVEDNFEELGEEELKKAKELAFIEDFLEVDSDSNNKLVQVDRSVTNY